jgi:hypothetical protein
LYRLRERLTIQSAGDSHFELAKALAAIDKTAAAQYDSPL